MNISQILNDGEVISQVHALKKITAKNHYYAIRSTKHLKVVVFQCEHKNTSHGRHLILSKRLNLTKISVEIELTFPGKTHAKHESTLETIYSNHRDQWLFILCTTFDLMVVAL